MAVERSRPVELPQDHTPTSLDLFRFSSETYATVRDHMQTAQRFRDNFTRIEQTFSDYMAAFQARSERIFDARELFTQQYGNLQHRIMASTAFIRVAEHAGDMKATPEQIMEFFLSCIKVNDRIPPTVAGLARIQNTLAAIAAQIQGPLGRRAGIDGLFNKLVSRTPAWFKGPPQEWRFFATRHAIFPALVDPGVDQIGATSVKARPDWLVRANGKPVNPEIAIAEYHDDKRQARTHRKTRPLFDKGIDAIVCKTQALAVQSAATVEEQRRTTLFPPQTFVDTVLLLSATQSVAAYDSDPKAMREMTMDQLATHVISPDALQQKTVDTFTTPVETGLSRESVALFLEHRLKEAGLLQDAKQPTSTDQIAMVTMLLDVMEHAHPDAQEIFSLLKEYNAPAFVLLNGDIRALLGLLNRKQLQYFRGFLNAQQGQPFEAVIWKIAEFVNERASVIHIANQPPTTQQSIHAIQEYTAEWLRSHFQWATQALVEKVQPDKAKTQTAEKTIIEEQIDVIGKEIHVLEQGNFAGWNLVYYHESEDSYTPFSAGSLSQKAEELTTITNEKGLSIDSQQVLLALEWLMAVPLFESLVISKTDETDDQLDKDPKMHTAKFGDLRLFYILDPQKKEFTFTVERFQS